MKMRKFAAMALCTAFSLVTFSSCGSPASQSASGAQSAGTSGDVPTIYLYLIQPNSAVNPDGENLKQIEKNLGINIELLPAMTEDQVNVAMASGEIPYYVADGISLASITKWIDEDLLLPLDEELVKETAPKLYAWAQKWLGEDPFMYGRFDGVNYYLPVAWSLGPHSNMIGYRQDWAEKLGIDPPTTLDEYEAMLQAFVDQDPDGNGKDDTVGYSGYTVYGNTAVWGAYDAYPGIYYEQDGEIVFGSIQPGAKDALERLHKWYESGILDKEFMVNKQENVVEKWNAEQVGSVENAWYHFSPPEAFYGGKYYKDLININPDLKIGTLVEELKGPTGAYGALQQNPNKGGFVFTKALANDEETLKAYLRYFEYTSFDPEGVELRQFGIEGETYEFSEDTGITWIPPYDQQQARDEFGIMYAGTSFNDYELRTPYETAPEYRELRAEMEYQATGKYEIMDRVYRPIFNELNGQLQAFEQKAIIDFITGAKPISEFDSFVQEWLDMGGQKVLDEANEAYAALQQ